MIEFGIDQRVCYKCKIEKPISEFHKNKYESFGHKYLCKDCCKKYKEEYNKKNKDYNKLYYLKNKERINLHNKNWNHDNIDKLRKYQKEWQLTEEGKICHNKSNKKYLKTSKGKINRIKIQTVRSRKLKFIPIMDNPFPNDIKIDWHHVNNIFVIPMPRITHNYYKCGIHGDIHRKNCNKWIKKIYSIDVDNLMCENNLSEEKL
jgi:aspartyl-tRNA synthetase